MAVVETLLAHSPHIRHEKSFLNAASYGQDEALKLLAQRGVSDDMLSKAFYHASDMEHEETVRILIESMGADANSEGEEYVFSMLSCLVQSRFHYYYLASRHSSCL